jgi:hypothetical protein
MVSRNKEEQMTGISPANRPSRRITTTLLVLALLLSMIGYSAATTRPAAAATGGNLLITGHDADLHCSGGAQCNYVKVAVTFVRAGSTLPVLALDHGTQVSDAITAAFAGGAIPTIEKKDPRTEFAGIALLDGTGKPRYSAIVIASDTTCGGCDNNVSTGTTPDSDAINARSADIAAFFNAGGGILAFAGAENRAVYYRFLPIPATGVAVSPPFTFTPEGLALGFKEGDDDNCCPTHNSFELPAAGGALRVAETDSAGKAETLFAQNAMIGDGGFTPGSPAPSTPPRGPFCDVDASQPYFTAIKYLADRGIARGQGGCFYPNDKLKRAHVAGFVTRSFGWADEEHGNLFTDRCGPDPYRVPTTVTVCIDDALWRQVGTLAYYDVGRGYRDLTFAPQLYVAHVQSISFITRAMVRKGYWELQEDNPAIYPNIPMASGHRQDVVTYLKYTQTSSNPTPIPGAPVTTAPWSGPDGYDQPATRAWFSQVLYQALITIK